MNSSSSALDNVLTAKLLVMIVDLRVVLLLSSVRGAKERLKDLKEFRRASDDRVDLLSVGLLGVPTFVFETLQQRKLVLVAPLCRLLLLCHGQTNGEPWFAAETMIFARAWICHDFVSTEELVQSHVEIVCGARKRTCVSWNRNPNSWNSVSVYFLEKYQQAIYDMSKECLTNIDFITTTSRFLEKCQSTEIEIDISRHFSRQWRIVPFKLRLAFSPHAAWCNPSFCPDLLYSIKTIYRRNCVCPTCWCLEDIQRQRFTKWLFLSHSTKSGAPQHNDGTLFTGSNYSRS